MSETNFDKPELVVTDNMRNLEQLVRAFLRNYKKMSQERRTMLLEDIKGKALVVSTQLAQIGKNDISKDLSVLLEAKLKELNSVVVAEDDKSLKDFAERLEDMFLTWAELSQKIINCFRGM